MYEWTIAILYFSNCWCSLQGRIQNFKLGGRLKNIASSGGMFGLFREILFFSILGGRSGCDHHPHPRRSAPDVSVEKKNVWRYNTIELIRIHVHQRRTAIMIPRKRWKSQAWRYNTLEVIRIYVHQRRTAIMIPRKRWKSQTWRYNTLELIRIYVHHIFTRSYMYLIRNMKK